METIEILDVTVIEPRLKHPTIFDKFDSLKSGESFIINNDHDPKPLYYQLLAERGRTFSWEYLANGPEVWQVQISKLNQAAAAETIGDMVAKDFRKAQVFKKLGIDFCCGGKKTLEEVCRKQGIDTKLVEEELAQFDNTATQQPAFDFNRWEIDFLSEYIVNTHHNYVKENLSFIYGLAVKVANVHGALHPETIEVATIFGNLAKDFELHLMKEENILFPFIKELVQAKKQGRMLAIPDFETVNSPVQIMESEHEQAGEDMAAIRKLTKDYQLPQDACASYTILYKKLQEFEEDLFSHVHLENNILFPKAIQLEKELQN